MRKGFWTVLGILSILAGISLLMQASSVFATRPPEKHLEFILGTAGLVGLCAMCAMACLFPKSHPITLRLLGVYGVFSCIFLIYDGLRKHRSEWINVLSHLPSILVFWLPGSIYLVIKGKMGDYN